MSKASDLIERMEQECGCRWDDNGGDNMAMAGIFGALARAMGKTQHAERDDVAAGVVLRHQMTPEYKAQERSNAIMAEMMIAGVSPDTLGDLFSKK